MNWVKSFTLSKDGSVLVKQSTCTFN